MSSQIYHFWAVVSYINLMVSLLGSSYIIISRFIKYNNEEGQLKINDYITAMSMVDFLVIVLRLIYFSNPAFNLTFMSDVSKTGCELLGFVQQILDISSSTFNFVIAICVLLPMLLNVPITSIVERRKWHVRFIIGMTFVCALLPWAGSAYGWTTNGVSMNGLKPYQCWISKREWFFSLYGPIFIYVVLSIVVVLCALFKKFRRSDSENRNDFITTYLIFYSSVFIFVWGGALLNRVISWMTDTFSMEWTVLRWLTVNSVGWMNASVWCCYNRKSKQGEIRGSSFSYGSSDKNMQLSEILSDITKQYVQKI